MYTLRGAAESAVYRYSALWLPSQRGGLVLCLQAQNHTLPVLGAVYFTGAISLPLWVPSQKGCLSDNPQEHHQ